MDAGGGRRRRTRREGPAESAGETLGPHAVVARAREESASPAPVEAADTDPEYALIPVEEDEEEPSREARLMREGEDGLVGVRAKARAALSPADERSPSVCKDSPSGAERSVVVPAGGDSAGLSKEARASGAAAAAAAAPTLSARRARGKERKEEEAIELSLALSDSSVEPAPSEATAAPTAARDVAADTTEAMASDGASTPPLPASRRKRKRSKKHVFSSRSKSGPARTRLGTFAPAPVTTAAAKEQTDHAHGKKRHLELGPGPEAALLYPSTPPGSAWQWDSCDVFFAPVGQESLDALERIRRSQANVVAANARAGRGLESEPERALLDAMAADAADCDGARVPLDQRRGRHYRDVWEEEDLAAAARRRLDEDGAADVPAAVQSNHDLVFGYDDDLFRDYLARLEAAAAVGVVASSAAAALESPTTQPQRPAPARRLHSSSSSSSSSSKRGKKAGRAPSPRSAAAAAARSPLGDVRPALPTREVHPASLGRWRLAKERHAKEPSYSVVHPASVSRAGAPVRWMEEAAAALRQRVCEQEEAARSSADADADGDSADGRAEREPEGKRPAALALALPSFGDAGLEQDEVSRAIAASVAALVPLSVANWRALQTVYERAACAQQCASVFEAEAAARRAVERLYARAFAPTGNSPAAASDAIPGLARRPVALRTRPRDLVAFSARLGRSHGASASASASAGRDGEDGEDAAAVAASVEFSMSLRRGDAVDVLDRGGCWSDGVVLDVLVEGGRYPKFVLVRLALWAAEAVEWVGVAEGRLLPRGVAAGALECVLSRSQSRGRALALTRQVAAALERSLPQRRARLAAVARADADAKAPAKRKRRRVGPPSV